ncbi:isochorismatase family protein [Methylomonas fluvii]|uniref:isochorismatase n=1 Tax=Methylomonas fluvii TaxID=1854564 RepID=A0ABR9DII5_9GAMM|nr:isochorismatase family protein [Methylomonas fluvii]MBD9362882.1 isochorismatase family protein [Methylomonas fluvii]
MSIPRIPQYDLPEQLPTGTANWRLDPRRAVLLVHDMQQYFLDFFEPSQPPIPALLRNCTELIAACRSAGMPVMYTAQRGGQAPTERGLLNDFWGPGLANDPAQERIVDAVAPNPEDSVFPKARYSAFKRSDLEAHLRALGRDQLVICGVYAHIGCLMTAAEAFMLDIQAFLVGDALADFSREEHEQALRYAAGRCACVLSSRDAMAALESLSPSLDALRREIAEAMAINPALLGDDDDLLLMGLDSLALMTLMQRWRQRGFAAEFAELAPLPTLRAWHALWQDSASAKADRR